MSLRRFCLPLLAGLLTASASQAQFTIDSGVIPSGSPANNSTTENVDFADVDLDGDWDAAMADGGDDGNDQNRIWINQGGLQAGTLGDFADETSTRFPTVTDDSRDIEFVDFDNDGDVDIYVSNTAQISNQGNRWWTNQGGDQAGSLGFYQDETTIRWLDLGNGPAGSSIAATQLIGGTFIDWSCDCDFGDLDNDGDMDLVHSSYGGSFGGEVPTRLFLNDGDGFFEEFNPALFQLSGPTISNGNPGLWCEGTQSSNTTVSDGTQCDIAATALDIDVADIDNDFDLDILHGARNEAPRMFVNRLDGSSLAPALGGGNMIFRDVTGLVFPAGYTQGTFGHYEQEMGDFDGDGSIDIYGLNWRFTNGFEFRDVVMTNNGDGTFGGLTELPDPFQSDDNEGDFFDVDNDGDLDLYIANFSGQDKLYLNNAGSYTLGSVPSFSAISLDADACDVDNDGDYDVLIAEDNFSANTFLRNTTGTPDTTAPYIPHVESLAPQTAGAKPIAVRASVYDNAPYYITWYNPTTVSYSVNGCELGTVPARSSGGQIFRAELPGNLVGNISYTFTSEDQYGNSTTSAAGSYTAAAPLPAATAYGTGSPSAAGIPEAEFLSVPVANSTWYVKVQNVAPNTLYFFLLTPGARIPAAPIGTLGLFNVNTTVLQLRIGFTDANGEALMTFPVPPAAPMGAVGYGQLFAAGGVSFTYGSSLGYEIQVQ